MGRIFYGHFTAICTEEQGFSHAGRGLHSFSGQQDIVSRPWDRNGEFLDTKYPFVCHAELNAILNHAAGSLQNAKIYVSLFPCNECAKAIIQSGIKEVVYWEDKYADTDGVKASKKMFELTGVKIRRYIPTNREITIRL